MPKRKRKRLALNWGPLLWLLFIANFIAGMQISSATSITRVRVVGADSFDQDRLTKAAQSLAGRPWMKTPTWSVVEEAMRRPDVRTANLDVNLLGRGLLKVTYHEPVAVLAGVPTVALSSEGVLIPLRGVHEELPTLRLDPAARGPLATFAGPWEGRKVAEICRRASMADLGKLTVEAQPNGAVNLLLADARIELGAPDKLVEKFDHIARFRAQDPKLLTGGATLVLISPERPSVRNANGP